MAYINVAEWTPEHVAEWLRGLEDSILPYVHFFLNNKIDGYHLLNLSSDDLDHLHIFKIGHQELILEAVDLLKHLHYCLTSETLQFLSLNLGCKARNLYSDLKLNGPQDNLENIKQEKVSTDTLSAVSDILVAVKSLISWLDRYPFVSQQRYAKIRKAVLKLSIELASTAQRDQFAEKPHQIIKNNTLNLAELCDKLVQEFNDSLIIHPASLDIATVKKKPDEELIFEYRAELALVQANVRLARLGMRIQSTYSGVHIIGGIKPQSPTTRCAKIEEGDEIVQVNYQTVIGWQLRKLVYAMREYPSEIHLTLKKRPRHTNILGQVIVLRPYRIPSKKTAFGKLLKWSEGNSSLYVKDAGSSSNDSDTHRDNIIDDNDDDDDSAFLPDDAETSHEGNLSKVKCLPFVMFHGPTHITVQRRATVSGASPTVLKAPVSIEDLVNGVPLIKRKKENISRSISHDPSKTNTSSTSSEVGKPLDTIKSDGSEENVQNISTLRGNDSYLKKVVYSQSSVAVSVSKRALSGPVADPFKGDKGPAQTSDMLMAQEEDYIILENKSLQAIRKTTPILSTSHKSSTRKNSSKESSHQQNTFIAHMGNVEMNVHKSSHSSSSCKSADLVVSELETNTKMMVPSDGNESGQYSNINTELSFSKLKSSEILHNANNLSMNDGSYQVVVVGGVAQKYVPTGKEGKRGPELAPQQKRIDYLADVFGSRRISCKDLGMGDCQGWLYKQKDKRGFFPASSKWTKRWMVLKDHCLYSYRDPGDEKAECRIYLPGSSVSPALESRTRKYCFKVRQQTTVFYFATESQNDMSKWMNKMGLSAIAYDATCDITTSGFSKPGVIKRIEGALYSETDDSDDSRSREIRLSSVEGHSSVHECSPSPSSSSENSFAEGNGKIASGHVDVHSKSEHLVFCRLDGYQQSDNMPKELGLSKEQAKRHNFQPISSEHSHCFQQQSCSDFSVRPKLDQSNTKSHFVSYNRSFSCTETSDAHQSGESIHDRKFSYDNTAATPSIPCPYDSANVSPEMHNPSSHLVAEEKEYDKLSSSLGRQKPIAKEISPGLVARMAVSYSNLSHKNAVVSNSSSKCISFKSPPATGYVAKISDSFDHWARENSSEIPKCHQLTKSKSSGQQLTPLFKSSCSQKGNYQRSASESHVIGKAYTSSHKPLTLCQPSQFSRVTTVATEEGNSIPLKQISMLDREYYRLYGRKKVSQGSIKSPVSPEIAKASNTPDNSMKFFPDIKNTQEILTERIVSHISLNPKGKAKDTEAEKHTFSQCFPYFRKTGFPSDNVEACGADSTMDGQSNLNLFTSHGGKSESLSVLKNHVQSVFRHQQKKLSEFSKGIENIAFCSPDQIKVENSDLENRSVESSDAEFASDRENHNRQSMFSVDALNTYYSNFENRTSGNPKSATLDQPSAKTNSAFKLFGSPKFMQKLNSPKLDKKNIFKSKKQAKEAKKLEQKEISIVQTERKFFGSPRLARAIFGSPKVSKKIVHTMSSGVQTETAVLLTDISPARQASPSELPSICATDVLHKNDHSIESSVVEHCSAGIVKSSSNSSLNSDASSSIMSGSTTSSHYYVETQLKPQITISLPIVTDKCVEDRSLTPETPRTPMKPTMGISMLGKRRLPSLSGESSVSITSSKGSHDDACSEPVQLRSEVKMEIGIENGYED